MFGKLIKLIIFFLLTKYIFEIANVNIKKNLIYYSIFKIIKIIILANNFFYKRSNIITLIENY